jgi:hypothetical protein
MTALWIALATLALVVLALDSLRRLEIRQLEERIEGFQLWRGHIQDALREMADSLRAHRELAGLLDQKYRALNASRRKHRDLLERVLPNCDARAYRRIWVIENYLLHKKTGFKPEQSSPWMLRDKPRCPEDDYIISDSGTPQGAETDVEGDTSVHPEGSAGLAETGVHGDEDPLPGGEGAEAEAGVEEDAAEAGGGAAGESDDGGL